ncbi:MAG: hypothetical protein ACE5F7_11500 [Nitrospiria bacterium]
MRHERTIKSTAVFVIWVVFSLPGAMTFETGAHLLKHHARSHHHAKQHATFACRWICGAVTPLHFDAPSFHQHALPPLAETVVTDAPRMYSPHFTSFYLGRAPPAFFG